jgi:S-adenosylmethionine/arginine decarboxylase-like enzyme
MTAQRYHIIIDITGVSEQKLTEAKGLEKFLSELPKVIGMRVLHPPVVAEGIPENPGLSGFVIIDYSHISIHTFTKSNQVLVDIFSCKIYGQEEAVGAVLKYFQVPRSAASVQQISWA